MTTSFWLRSASVLTLLLALGHTAGYPWTPDLGAASMSVVSRMQSVHFMVMGFEQSFWAFYVGFGLTISVMLLLLAVLLWQVPAAVPDPRKARLLIVAMLAAFVLISGLDWVFFFTAPLMLAVASTVCLALALASGRTSDQRRGHPRWRSHGDSDTLRRPATRPSGLPQPAAARTALRSRASGPQRGPASSERQPP